MPQYLLRLPEDDALYVTLMKPKAMAILFDDINVFCVYSICGIGHIMRYYYHSLLLSGHVWSLQ